MNREVVITGFGAVTPLGNDRETTWRGLVGGQSGVGKISSFDADSLPVRIAAEVRGFDATTILDPKRLRRSARFTHFAVAAAREALADAGYPGIGPTRPTFQTRSANPTPPALSERVFSPDEADRVGVVINSAVAGFDTIESATRSLLDCGEGRIGPHFVSSSLSNMPACEVAIDLGAHGPVTATALACASGLYAFLEARRLITSGEADVVICGGTDAAITPVMFAGLTAMGAMSHRNDDPAAASRPFDANRDGFVFGEGAVVAVVESADRARRRGATAYAAVAGGALTTDAFHVSAPEPNGAYAAEAIRRALINSGLAAEDVDYVSAHGTATRANDAIETAAIRAAFGGSADALAVSSPKSMVGHMIGGAGALGAMVCALAIRDSVVPPTINLTSPDPDCDLDYVAGTARPLPVRAALANAFGFGGQNCVVAFVSPEDS